MFKAVYVDFDHLPRWQCSGFGVSSLHQSSCGCDNDLFQTEGSRFLCWGKSIIVLLQRHRAASLLVLSFSVYSLLVHVLNVCCACDCNCYVEQLRRRGSAAFAGKQGFITLRDLFRWGERYRLAGEKEGTFYDWDQHIADEGYLVLAGRVRKQEECHVIQDVIKRHINRTVDPQRLFTCKL